MARALFIAQRLSALVLAPLVLVHLGVILWAVRGGLTAGEILGRTQGSAFWALFYGLFVLAAAVHAPIGIRNILREWTGLSRPAADGLALGLAIVMVVAGFRAVFAVTGGAP